MMHKVQALPNNGWGNRTSKFYSENNSGIHIGKRRKKKCGRGYIENHLNIYDEEDRVSTTNRDEVK